MTEKSDAAAMDTSYWTPRPVSLYLLSCCEPVASFIRRSAKAREESVFRIGVLERNSYSHPETTNRTFLNLGPRHKRHQRDQSQEDRCESFRTLKIAASYVALGARFETQPQIAYAPHLLEHCFHYDIDYSRIMTIIQLSHS